MSNYIGNATAEHLRDMASEVDRTCGSNMTVPAIAGALRAGAAEIDRLQKMLNNALEKFANPIDYIG